MATQLLNLPVNIPWKLVAASPDMMDRYPFTTALGAQILPPTWRSSLAIYAYEPKPEDLDEALCDQRITFVKITCSITGYQISEEDYDVIVNYTDQLDPQFGTFRIDKYFACYGVLLNVSVFPAPLWERPEGPHVDAPGDVHAHVADPFDDLRHRERRTPPPLEHYPRIIDFEPKKRDLYQAATETGEILTTSRSAIQTDKSFTNTQNSQTGLDVGAEVPLKGVTGKANLKQTWGETDQDKRTITVDASRESRERQGTTTNLNQMYNLLTGYHSGTNRATFLMLPRPHTLQTAEPRTFVQGLRVIEGVQDFFLVVSRPEHIEGLCIQPVLDTGHIVEDTGTEYEKTITSVEQDYERKDVEVDEISVFLMGNHTIAGFGSFLLESTVGATPIRDEKPLPTPPSGYHGFEVDRWEFDPEKGDTGHGSITQEVLQSDDVVDSDLEAFEYYAQSPDTVVITGKVFSTGIRNSKTFHRKYTVHLRRQKRPSAEQPHQENRANLLVTERSLSVCIKHDGDCVRVMDGERPRNVDLYIANEHTIDAKVPNVATAYRQIQSKMTSSDRTSSRRPAGSTSFIDTDYFKDQVKKTLPEDKLTQPLDRMLDVPDEVVEKLGKDRTVADVLDMDLSTFARRAGMSIEDAAGIRRRLLGLPARKKEPGARSSDEKGSK